MFLDAVENCIHHRTMTVSHVMLFEGPEVKHINSGVHPRPYALDGEMVQSHIKKYNSVLKFGTKWRAMTLYYTQSESYNHITTTHYNTKIH